MAFSAQQLQKFANLIKIEMTDDELSALNLDQVYDWMGEMKGIDTTNVSPMFSPAMHAAPMREDTATDTTTRDEVLANSPDKTGIRAGFFAVPKVMDE